MTFDINLCLVVCKARRSECRPTPMMRHADQQFLPYSYTSLILHRMISSAPAALLSEL